MTKDEHPDCIFRLWSGILLHCVNQLCLCKANVVMNCKQLAPFRSQCIDYFPDIHSSKFCVIFSGCIPFLAQLLILKLYVTLLVYTCCLKKNPKQKPFCLWYCCFVWPQIRRIVPSHAHVASHGKLRTTSWVLPSPILLSRWNLTLEELVCCQASIF